MKSDAHLIDGERRVLQNPTCLLSIVTIIIDGCVIFDKFED